MLLVLTDSYLTAHLQCHTYFLLCVFANDYKLHEVPLLLCPQLLSTQDKSGIPKQLRQYSSDSSLIPARDRLMSVLIILLKLP